MNLANTMESASEQTNRCEVCGVSRVRLVGKWTMKQACKCEKEQIEKDRAIMKKKERQLRLEKLRSHSLMDKKFEQCTFENWEREPKGEKYYKMATEYTKKFKEMKDKNVGMLIWGPAGTGKTYMTACIANELLKNLNPVIAISSIGILNKIKDTYGRYGSEGEIQIINSLKNASLLILDDLGAEKGGEWSETMLYSIIDSRYRNEKPMIVTTNLNPEQLQKKLGQRTYDRLVEMCVPIEFKGPSKRTKHGSEKTKAIRDLLK